MPKVPDYHMKPLKSIFPPRDKNAPAGYKQKNLIITMCERRKINVPDLEDLTMGDAADMIAAMLDDRD